MRVPLFLALCLGFTEAIDDEPIIPKTEPTKNDFSEGIRLDISKSTNFGITHEHYKLDQTAFIDTYQPSGPQQINAVFDKQKKIIDENVILAKLVIMYNWVIGEFCTIVPTDETKETLHLHKIHGEWTFITATDFLEAEADTAPGIIININAPCTNVNGLRCVTKGKLKTFIVLKYFIVDIVTDNFEYDLFLLEYSKQKRILQVSVQEHENKVFCSIAIKEPNGEVTKQNKTKYGDVWQEMNPEDFELWKTLGFRDSELILDDLETSIIQPIKNFFGSWFTYLGNSVSSTLSNAGVAIKLIDGPMANVDSLLIPYNVAGDLSASNVKLTVINILSGAKKYVISVIDGFRINPVMYKLQTLWADENAYVYRIEVIEACTSRIIRIDVFISNIKTQSVYFSVDKTSFRIITHYDYFCFRAIHMSNSFLKLDVSKMEKVPNEIITGYELYHKVADNDKNVTKIMDSRNFIWSNIRKEGNELLAMTFLKAMDEVNKSLIWITLRYPNAMLRYENILVDGKMEAVVANPVDESIITEIREFLANTVVTSTTEMSLLKSIKKYTSLDIKSHSMINKILKRFNDEERRVYEPPVEVGFNSITINKTNEYKINIYTSAIYRNSLGAGSFFHFRYFTSGSNEMLMSTRLLNERQQKLEDHTYNTYVLSRRTLLVKVHYEVRRNSPAITWHLENDNSFNSILGYLTVGYFIEKVRNDETTLWSYMEGTGVIFDHVHIVLNRGRAKISIYTRNSLDEIIEAAAVTISEKALQFYKRGWFTLLLPQEAGDINLRRTRTIDDSSIVPLDVNKLQSNIIKETDDGFVRGTLLYPIMSFIIISLF
ncbi:hypothetical protein BdWA1_003465 [Babesia duncani]|uniref:Uncharacterized protein n=1 Tax=Babesia duncani TaxID=323732 RepID=A0AAD9PIS1_9APIC|nr:hypothetical protein BdWA1_003465 [Babesia duncani]